MFDRLEKATEAGMGSYGDRVRQALLDSAEELFAAHGIDAVSNRRIAEHAGNSNHSAVNYHFGSRDELIRACCTDSPTTPMPGDGNSSPCSALTRAYEIC